MRRQVHLGEPGHGGQQPGRQTYRGTTSVGAQARLPRNLRPRCSAATQVRVSGKAEPQASFERQREKSHPVAAEQRSCGAAELRSSGGGGIEGPRSGEREGLPALSRRSRWGAA